jgi:thiol-disulfide isomerase/thioredoxin
MPMLAFLQFLHVGIYYAKKTRIQTWLILGLSLLLCAFKMFNGLFLDAFSRFFFDCLVYFEAGYFLLRWKKRFLSFEAVFFLLFSTALIVFSSAGVLADIFFLPLMCCLPLSLLLLYIVSRVAKPYIAIIPGICLIACLAYFVFPNYMQALSGKELTASDRRVELPMVNAKGDTVTVQSSGSKIFVLDVWFSGCGICFKKFPALAKLADKYRNDSNVVIAALNIPLENETNDTKAFDLIAKYKCDAYKATSNITMNTWGIDAYPTVLIFDKNHQLRYSGQIETDSRIVINNTYRIINKLLKE